VKPSNRTVLKISSPYIISFEACPVLLRKAAILPESIIRLKSKPHSGFYQHLQENGYETCFKTLLTNNKPEL